MSWKNYLSIEYSVRDIARGVLLVAGGLTLAFTFLGRGTDRESDIESHGQEVEADKGFTEIDRAKEEKEESKCGLYINSELYLSRAGNIHYHDREEDIVFDFKVETKKNIADIILNVDGQRLDISRMTQEDVTTGNTKLVDFTKKGKYDVHFEVRYRDGKKNIIYVDIEEEK